jgi:hypothetical protein
MTQLRATERDDSRFRVGDEMLRQAVPKTSD